MKILRSMFVVLALGLVTISSANARDSFSFGLNIGGYGPPPVSYYPAPPVVYYGAPTVYYAPQPFYYGPRASFRYYDNDRRHHHGNGWGRDHDRGHRGWDRDGRGHRGGDGRRDHR